MKFVKIDPPGSWCHKQAVYEMIAACGGKTFVDVGCGGGELSLQVCAKGLSGVGVDFSDAAIEESRHHLREFISDGRYRLVKGDASEGVTIGEPVDLGLSMMVMEHVEDDVGFLQSIASLVKSGGHVIVAVPGRQDRWGIEDETVGHLRRYDRDHLRATMEKANLSDVRVWSVAVPVANLLFHIGNFLVRNSPEMDKRSKPMREQTESSGIREIPFKTVFPSVFKLLLNPVTLAPLFVLQRLFYPTGLGLTMMASGKVNAAALPSKSNAPA